MNPPRLLSPQLQAFEVICRVGTVHAAAAVLRLTQTAVTQRIQILEADLKATLFIRSRKGMQLTDAGQALLKYCKQTLDLEGEVFSQLGGAGSQAYSKIIIEGPSSILRSRIVPTLKTILPKFPKLTAEFKLSDFSSGVLSLKQGMADLVIIPRDQVVNEFSSKLLHPERYVLVGATAWAKKLITDVIARERIVDFDPNDRMTYNFLDKYKWRPLARDDRHFVNNTDALADMLTAGIGYSVLAEEFAKPMIAQKKLVNLAPGKFYDYPIAAAYYARKHPPAYWTTLLKSLA